MSDSTIAAQDLNQPPLSQAARVVDTFIAPSKTFRDILRDSSWWMPFLLMVLFTVGTTFVVDRQVGFDRVTENQVHQSPKSEDRMSQLTPEQRAKQMAISSKFTRIFSYATPVFLVIFFAIYALILWGSFNFGLGAETKFMQVFALTWYTALPYVFRSILTILQLHFGNNEESFNIRNPVGTNPGFYMPDASSFVRAFAARFDLIELWSLVLVVIGMSILAKKSIAQSAMIVVGLWVVMTFIFSGLAAIGG